MRKVLKTLKFIGAYLLITLVTAVGVVFLVPVNSTNANIGSGNSTNINQTVTESNFTKIVNNLMQLRDFSVDAKVSLATEQGEQVDLSMFVGVHATAGFATIGANGDLSVTYQGQTYDLNIIFVDNQLYLSVKDVQVPVLDNDFSISTYNNQDLKYTVSVNSLVDAVGKIMDLLGVEIAMPDMFNNFDMSMIATLLEDYTEEETTTGYDVTITVMGQKINLSTDAELNVKSVHIPTISVGGIEIDADLELTRYEHEINISHPQDQATYTDLAKVTNLIDFAKQILQNKYIQANISANIADTQLDLATQIDFGNGLHLVASSNTLGDPLNLMLKGEQVYFNFGNIKVSADVHDFKEVLTYLEQDLGTQLNKLGIEQLDQVVDTLQTTLATIKQPVQIAMPSISELLGIVGLVQVDGDNLVVDLGTIKATVVVSNNAITNIIVQGTDFEANIAILSVQKQPIVFDTTGYTQLQDILPTAKALVNTICSKGIYGDLNLTFGETTYTASLKVNYDEGQIKLNLSTVIFNKSVEINIQNDTLYVAVDNTKIKIPFDQAQELIGTITTLFGLDSTTTTSESEFSLKDISASFITQLIADGNSLTIKGSDYAITLGNKNGYIDNIAAQVSGLDIEFVTLKCGNVNIDEINDSQYSHYQEYITYIQTIKDILTQPQLDITLATQVKYQTQVVDVTALVNVNVQDFALDLSLFVTVDGTTYVVDATYVDGTLYLNYKDLRLKADKDIFQTITSVVQDILPKYIDMSQVQSYIDSLQTSMPSFDTSIDLNVGQILTLVQQYSNILRRFSFENQTLSIALDLRTITDIDQILYIDLGANNNRVSLQISEFEIDKLSINLNVDIAASSSTITAPYNATEYKDINNYLKLISILDNTISSAYFDLGLQVVAGDYTIDANAILDLTDGVKVALSSNSLGSDLDIKFMQQADNKQNVFFITFGNLKLNCSVSQLNKLYDFLTLTVLPEVGGLEVKELEPLLDTIGEVVNQLDVILGKAEAEQSTTPQSAEPQAVDITQTIDQVIDIFNCLTVTDNKITFVYDNIHIVIDIENNIFSNIYLQTADFELNIKLNSNTYTDKFSFDTTEYVEFDNIYTKLDALVSTLITRQIAGTVQLQVLSGDYLGTYSLDYILSYAGNSVYFDLSTTIFGQYIHIAYEQGILYLTIDELNLTANWEERYAITDYINQRFGTNLVFPSLKLEDLFPKQQNPQPIDLQDINLAILTSLKATDTNLQIVLDNIIIDINNKGTVVTDIQVTDGTSFALDFNIDKVGSQVELISPVAGNYSHYTTLTNYIDEIAALVDSSKQETTDQYSITGSAYLYRTNFKGVPELVTYEDGHQEYKDYVKISLDNLNLDITDKLLDQLAVDLSVTGKGSLYQNSIGGLDAEFAAYFNSNNTNGGLYINYNKLKAYLEKSALANIITTVKELLPMFVGNDFNAILDMIKFNDNDDIYVELGSMPDMTANINILELIETYAPMLTTLKLDASGVLSIGFDLSSLTDAIKEPIVLKIYTDAQNNLHLACDGLFIGGNATDGYNGISFDLVVDTIGEFVGTPSDNTSYMDLSRADELLRTLTNTLRDRKEFHLESQVNLAIADILNWYIDLVIDIKIIDNKPVIAVNIGEIPVIDLGVNNDVPFETGDTNGGYDRYLNIYYKDNYVYFHRTELVQRGFGIASPRTYEKKLKVTLDEFMADPLGLLLQYGFGFKDLVMNPIREAIAKSQANTDPLDYSNILLGFEHTYYSDTDTQSFFLNLNLQELSKNDDLKTLQITLFTSKKDNVEYLTDIDVFMDIDVGIAIILQTKNSNNNLTPIKLDLTRGCDVSTALNFINTYSYGVGEEWHYADSEWQQDSGNYDIIFNTNYDGYTIDTINAHVGTTITLPTITVDKVVVNGNDKDTYKFAGWSASSTLKGTIYNGEYTVPRGGANLYAVWENVESIRSINYYIDGKLMYTQTGVVGSQLNYPYNVADIELVENGEKVWKVFDGWIDANGIRVQSIEQETQDVYPTYKTIHTWRTITYKSNIVGIADPAPYSNYDSQIISLYNYSEDQQVNSDGVTTTYRFEGWYYDAEYTKVCNITNMPTDNITLYAKWSIVSQVSERNITIYDNGVAVYSKNLISGTALDINTIVAEDSDVVYNSYTKWYTDSAYTTETTFPTSMPSDSDIVLHIRNRYHLDITYYAKEVVNGLDAHVEKHYTDDLYQGETFSLPTQSDYEITYYTNATKAVPTHMTAYQFSGYIYNGTAAPAVMDNSDMTITSSIRTTTLNFYSINFHTDWKRPGGWVTDGKSAEESNMHHGVEYALDGSTLQGTTLTRKTSILNNTTETETIIVSMSRTYGGPRYYFESACWNTTGCKMLYSWGSNGDASNELININSNKDVYVEWKNV